MHLSHLHLINFRNYEDLTLEIPAEGCLFRGSNGTGKTNILEAVHMLCIGRSQRHARRSAMIRTGAEICRIEGRFEGDTAVSPSRIVGLGFDRSRNTAMSIDNEKIASLREWFGQGAVVSFGPDDVGLIGGEPAARRRFLDILICQLDPAYLDALVHYQSALANRNAVLARRGDENLLDVYDNSLAANASVLVTRRREIVAFCQDVFADSYAEICGRKEVAKLEFKPSFSPENDGIMEWKNVFFKALKDRRKTDIEQGFSGLGPHRDDLVFRLNGRTAKGYASQGQYRSLALALKLAAVACIEAFRYERMLFLVDDAFAELDDERMAAVYGRIKARGQIFMTTPLARLPITVDIEEYTVFNGSVAPR
jgi:DNA replication and repair protein RecF